MHNEMGEYSAKNAAVDDARWLKGITTDYLEDLTYIGQKRIHNLKYFTWVEQQGKTLEEINAQLYQRDYWTELQGQIPEIDAKIEEFNERVGLL
jgi:cysteine synthase